MSEQTASMAEAGRPATETSSSAHSYNVRICHWVNFAACVYLLWSGVHIFLDFPELYWGHTGYRGYPAAFRLEDWGLSWDEAGALGDRRWGRNYHFTAAWVFLINGLVYVVWNLYSRHFRNRMLAPRSTYGTLQRTSYLILIFVFVPFMILSGVAQSPGFTAAMPVLLDMFGGRQTARTLHTIGTVALVLFVLVHVVEVARAGFFVKVRSMITGREGGSSDRPAE
jgi:thiosulfate reductase cytochrome b subunit